MAHQLATSPKLVKVDLSGLRSMNSGAAYLPPDIRDRLYKRAKNMPHFGEGYGMSECVRNPHLWTETLLTPSQTVAAIVLPFPGVVPDFQDAPGCTGLLLPSMKARIVREDGSEADYDEPGELLLFGKNVTLGYHNNEKSTRETFVDGWLHTGDKFKVDRRGRFL